MLAKLLTNPIVTAALGVLAAVLLLVPKPVPLPVASRQSVFAAKYDQAIQLAADKNEELADTESKLTAAEAHAATLNESLNKAEHNALDIHDREVDSLRLKLGDLQAAAVRGHYTDLESAEIVARATGRKVLLMLTATWCGPCQAVKNGALANGKVQGAIEDRWVFALVDGDLHPDTATMFGNPRYPAMFSYVPGESISPGFVPPANAADFLATIKSLH